jgi:hypothetical protein
MAKFLFKFFFVVEKIQIQVIGRSFVPGSILLCCLLRGFPKFHDFWTDKISTGDDVKRKTNRKTFLFFSPPYLALSVIIKTNRGNISKVDMLI